MAIFAMLFPGQGAQYVGMLSSFFNKYDIFKHTFDEASHNIGIDLWKLIKEGPQKKINISQYTQPIILSASVAIYRIWKERYGKLPSLISGHSLGEYSALVCANSIQFSDAVKIVFLRGKLMQEETINKPSAMHAIEGLDKKTIEKICSLNKKNQIVSISSINSYNQIVISGDREAVHQASIQCKKSGATAVLNLNINIPAHCYLMKPICKKFRKILNKINIDQPNIPIINNVDVKIENFRKNIIDALIRQLYSPVRWKETIDFILSKKIFYMIEVGPNKILTNLNKENKNIIALSTNNINNFLIAFQKINKGHNG